MVLESHPLLDMNVLRSTKTDRVAVARFIADLIASGEGVGESLGVTN